MQNSSSPLGLLIVIFVLFGLGSCDVASAHSKGGKQYDQADADRTVAVDGAAGDGLAN